MGRYSTLYRLPGNLYTVGSPVLIPAGALLKDEQIGTVLAQLKFRSLSAKEIKAVKICIHAFDVTGEALEDTVEYQYLDLAVLRGEDFGDRRAIPLPNPVARSFEVGVKSVLFADGSAWNAESEDAWLPLPHPVPLAEALGSDTLASQYVRETSDRSAYAPVELDDIWYCSCGTVNKHEESYCISCGAEKTHLLDAMDEGRLESAYEKWTEKKTLDSSAEQQHTRKKKSKLLKALLIIIPLILAALGIFIAVTQYLTPMMAYKRAQEKLDLQDYAGAIEGFTALGSYQDSADKVIEARYGAAVKLMESGDTDIARTEFILLGDYKDCDENIRRCDYIAAEKQLSAKDYDRAYNSFLLLGDYSDAADRAKSALYDKAQALLSEGDTDGAIAVFESLGDYSDSADKIAAIKQDAIDRVYRLIRQNKLDEAWEAHSKLNDYQPEPLSKEDFINDDGDMCAYLDENTTGDMNFGAYRYDAGGYDSRKNVTCTARGIRLTSPIIEVIMAYGEPMESGPLITDGGFYPLLNEDMQKQMAEECAYYYRYSMGNYNIYFYFNENDEVTWIFYTNGDYKCLTSTVSPEAAPEA